MGHRITKNKSCNNSREGVSHIKKALDEMLSVLAVCNHRKSPNEGITEHESHNTSITSLFKKAMPVMPLPPLESRSLTRRVESIPIIKDESYCDDDIQHQEHFYDMATWRMYNRIQSHRKIHHYKLKPHHHDAWDGIALTENHFDKTLNDADDDSYAYPILFQLDMDD